jgi:hypothetical protein
MASRIRESCRRSAVAIASGCASHNFVLPSMSVKRKVTVPLGSIITRLRVQVGYERLFSARRGFSCEGDGATLAHARFMVEKGMRQTGERLAAVTSPPRGNGEG